MVRKKLEFKAFIDGALDVICSSYQWGKTRKNEAKDENSRKWIKMMFPKNHNVVQIS